MITSPTPIPAGAPRPGSLWKHWKGHRCVVIYVCHHTETGELLVVYRETATGDVWARPLAMWADEARPGVQRFVDGEMLDGDL